MKPNPKYEKGDDVEMMVTENGQAGRMSFTVEASRKRNGKFEYQLKRIDNNTLHKNGQWFDQALVNFQK